MVQLAILLAVLPAATIEPAQVPAQGGQAAMLTMERAGMVRLQAKGGDGTACVLVDQLRGPFASAGVVGKEDCALDQLLDVGRYKVRLESPARSKAKGPVDLTARIFGEANPTPIGLLPGRPVEQPLPDGSQASFWFRVTERAPVTLRVAGRTAGAVHLWRAGTWREKAQPLHLQPEPNPGQPIHEWWVQAVLEPGDYQVVAYGTSPLRFTRGEETNLLTVELGFARSPERTVRATLGASGLIMAATDKAPLTAFLTVENPGAGRVRLSVHPIREDGSRLQEEDGNCVVEPKAQAAECAVRVGDGRHVVLVRGASGTSIMLRWVPRRFAAAMLDGEYTDAQQRLSMEPVSPGDYLLGIHDVPGDVDASPLGCALERQPERGGPRELQAWDAPKVGGDRGLLRSFNYRGYESLWFEVTERGEYAISTSGERRSSCEVGTFQPDGMTRLAEGSSQGCNITRRLSPGLHLLKLSGGTEGIERVRISGTSKDAGDSPARTSCAFKARLEPGYRYALLSNRSGRVAARGLVVRRLPLTLEAPLPVEIPAGETLSLPLASALGPVRVVTPSGAPAGCHLQRGGPGAWRDGACWLDAKGPDELGLTAPPGAPLLAWLTRPEPGRSAEVTRAFSPARSDLPGLLPGERAYFDFEPNQQRDLALEVKEAGLYDVGTEGLLATTCSIRTPALSDLAADRRGGRGRNCLVSTYLRPGQYLVSVSVESPSRGRAAVVLTRRPGRELARATGEGERFFRVEPGELIRQRIAVPKAGRWELSASALGAQLRCRLEDREGWPLEPVPGPCHTVQDLPAGEVVWTQLPLTVESMRRSAVALERPPVVLRGGKAAEELALWHPYSAELGKSGRDEFRFSLPAEADVYFLLTNGMLGRLFREGETQALELIPPIDRGGPPGAPPDEDVSPPPPADAAMAEGGSDGGDVPQEGEAAAEADASPAPQPPRRWAPPRPQPVGTPPGYSVHLAAGRYRLVAEHSRGDVAIAYQVQVSVDPLMPGVERDLPVPSRIPVRLASAGTLRLRTTGEADVRCRLFDAAGRLVAQSSEVGEDWNCGLAEPVAAGDYLLEIESETVTTGVTRLALTQPSTSDAGPLVDGSRYHLSVGVLSATLPPPQGDAVLEASLEAAEPFSCALDDDQGRLVSRSGPGTSCTFMLVPAGKVYRLRAWTLDRPTEVTARLKSRPVVELSAGRLPDGGAVRARLPRPGTFQTAEGVRCLTSSSGLLVPCGPEVSLEAGPVVLAAAGPRSLTLGETVSELGVGRDESLPVGSRTLIQRQRSSAADVHLVAVTVPPGERVVPSCLIEGGVSTSTPSGCYAASSPSRESLLRLVASEPVETRVWRAAVSLPRVTEWGAGRHQLEAAGGTALLELPSGAVRAELTLPPRAWSVLLVRDKVEDLCAPSPALARCSLTAGDGGHLLVVLPGERHVEGLVTSLPSPPPTRELASLHEEEAPLPAVERWHVPAAATERLLRVEGAASCSVALDDGARSTSCSATIPAGLAGTLLVEHGAGPLRLLLAPRDERLALAGGPLPGGSPRRLLAGEAVALEGLLVDRSLELAADVVVHVRAERGVCLLLSGGKVVASGGLGDGCRLDRLLGKGTHRLVVRAFAGAPLSGIASWSSHPVEAVAEGVNPERWLAPGDTQLFRFKMATKGRVGLGLREDADRLECAVLDAAARTLGEGCQQLLALDAGSYLLSVRSPASAPPVRFRPVLLGLAGAEVDVPDEYLKDFFQRIGGSK
jgi:hypothetical protein